MIVIEPGHIYQLADYDKEHPKLRPNQLFFFKRVGEGYPGNFPPPHHGTNCQEVLRVLIDRMQYLDNQIPCFENKMVISNLRECIWFLEARACKRHEREIPIGMKHVEIELLSTCIECGHLYCSHRKGR